jgi:hypothetical protein
VITTLSAIVMTSGARSAPNPFSAPLRSVHRSGVIFSRVVAHRFALPGRNCERSLPADVYKAAGLGIRVRSVGG